MRKYFPLMTVVTSMFLLVACMVPGTFKAKYTLDNNGQYSFVYDGTIINLFPKMAEKEAAEKGKPIEKSVAKDTQALAADLEKDSRTKSFNDVGNDTYKVIMEDAGDIKEKKRAYFLSKDFRYWTLTYDEQNNTVVFTIEPSSQNNIDLLKELNVSPIGEISFDTKLNLVSSTKELSKSFFGSTYSIKVDSTTIKEGLTVVWSLK